MPSTPSRWNMKEVNQWWKRGMDKERASLTRRPRWDRSALFAETASTKDQVVPSSFTKKKGLKAR